MNSLASSSNSLAPSSLLAAQAIDHVGDPQLAAGVHLRVLPSEQLGLPVAPLLVYRLNLGPDARAVKLRSDIVWRDSRGQTLEAPFPVSPDNPVTGYLPPPASGVCCWIEVLGKPTQGISELPLAGRARELVPSAGPRAPELVPRGGWGAGLQVSALVSTPLGDAPLARVSRPAYQLAASRIERVLITGRGEVEGVRWVDARSLLISAEDLWRVLALPVGGGARYAGIPQAAERAKERVARGAPVREPLYEAATAVDASSTPAATAADELDRVFARTPSVAAWLDLLLNDLSQAPQDLTSAPEALLDANGVPRGDVSLHALGSTLAAALDPGVGRWLGLVDLDDDLAGAAPSGAAPGDVIAYLIRGVWRSAPARAFLGGAEGADPTALRPGNTIDWPPDMPPLPAGDKEPLADLLTVACATIGNPPDRLSPPALDTPIAGAWLPAPAPTAIREVDTPVGGLAPGALLAFARSVSGTITSLNSLDSNGRPLPLAAAPPGSASAPGEGVLHDRAAPPQSVAYRAAQADWFGRWSGWAQVEADPGTRPLPPRPSVSAFYVQAAFADPVPSGGLAGTIRVRVPYPPESSLAPGANLLDHLEVTVDGVVTNAPAPTGTPDDVEVEAAGPALARCEQRTSSISARWVDSAGVASLPSDPVSLLCVDPRPPAQTVLPNTLRYASRPDVTGRARVMLQWGTSPDQQRFRVFFATERTLQSKLGLVIADATDPRGARAQTIMATLSEGMSAPDRAAVYRANADFFTREWWDQLTTTPIETSGPTAQYEHELPGALRLVAFYRVLAVSASNVDADFPASPMAAFGVPNTSPPAKPLLRINLDPTAPLGQARLHVRVPPGPVPAAAFRLRRSSTTSADVVHMPISASGSVAQSAPGTLGQEFDVVDLGPTNVTSAPLRAWVKYSWRVEVQGPPEPGGGPPGDWSQASAPVSTALVPSGAPAAPTALSAVAAGAGQIALSWQHPETLLGGSIGSGAYTCEVYRRGSDGREQLAHTVPADAPPGDGGRAPDRTGSFSWTDPGPVPSGTSYRVAVVDPIGRRSGPSAEVTVP